MSEDARPERERWLAQADAYTQAILEAAADMEFDSFLVGMSAKAHEKPQGRFLKRVVGTALYEAWNETRAVDFLKPQLSILCKGLDEAGRGIVTLRPRAVYLYGRYRKLTRGISQTRWVKRSRKKTATGRKVVETHKITEESVQELLAAPVNEAYGAYNLPLFHGMGREDADVLMLGEGRPFVLEVLKPPRRKLDLAALTERINAANAGKVSVSNLRVVDEEAVALVKEHAADKSYRALCQLTGPWPGDAAILALGEQLSGVTLEQRTPQRVSRRRADLVRRRTVRSAEARALDPEQGRFELILETQSGTYIKELISSDEGRTRPSVAELLGQPCVCAELDVLAIHASDEEALGGRPCS